MGDRVFTSHTYDRIAGMKRSTYAEVVLLAAITLLGGCASNAPERLDKSPAYHWGYARAFAYSPDGRTLVALRDRLMNAAEILDANTLTVIHTLKGSEGPRMVMTAPPGSVAFSPNGDLLATAGVDDVVVLWDARTWKERRRLPDTKWASGVSFLPDGRTLATAGPGETVRLWDTDTGAQNASLEGQQGAAISVDVSRDGRLLAVGGNRQGSAALGFG